MIAVTITKSKDVYRDITCLGHAGFSKKGQPDIVCAAVSILVINTLNAIERFTDARYTEVQSDEKRGYIFVRFPDDLSKEAILLLDTLEMGLTNISEEYGRKYISVDIKEAS